MNRYSLYARNRINTFIHVVYTVNRKLINKIPENL
jgi:hypothetical protein